MTSLRIGRSFSGRSPTPLASAATIAAPFGDIPLVVIYGTQGFFVPKDEEAARLRREADSLRNDYPRLSRRGRLVLDTLSGHHTHLDNPTLVVTAIRELLRTLPSRP